jgi:hypothetical protein
MQALSTGTYSSVCNRHAQVMALFDVLLARKFDMRWVQHDGQHLTGFVDDMLNGDLLQALLSSASMRPH